MSIYCQGPDRDLENTQAGRRGMHTFLQFISKGNLLIETKRLLGEEKKATDLFSPSALSVDIAAVIPGGVFS